ncbi:acyl-CoA-binding protein 1 [Chytriomyces cf. hyalinus JEL632]|nr:acyl-CoA-binding protein 1 [Chytriomyces cf. hyalinus JEL632]
MTAFEDAAAAVKSLTYNPNNDELLALYGLFKQATVGDNTTAKPGMLELQAGAKWGAWTKNQGMSKADAEAQYVALVESLKAKQ